VKKKISLAFAGMLVLIAALAGYVLLGPGTAFRSERRFLLVRTGMEFPQLMDLLETDSLVAHPFVFRWLAKRTGYAADIKAGRYEIRQGTNLINLLRTLAHGHQTPVTLVITKLRTKEDFASLVGRKFECDSMSVVGFLENNDSLRRFGLDSNTAMTAIFPNSFSLFWNSTASRIYRKIYAYYLAYWTPERRESARRQSLDPTSAYILASIVEEETTEAGDKGKIASVYLNRMARGMKLSADPTVKFALRNFSLKRIYDKYLETESPYNTYQHPGLPPGPICTPSESTVDAVLSAPSTNYLYFVAKPDFSGYSNFSETYPQHLAFAKAYQQALDREAKTSSSASP
jgi:UPF0755 protein